MVTRKRDFGQSITYTIEELEKYSFNDSILYKIINGIKDGSIPIDEMGISIKKVLSLTK